MVALSAVDGAHEELAEPLAYRHVRTWLSVHRSTPRLYGGAGMAAIAIVEPGRSPPGFAIGVLVGR